MTNIPGVKIAAPSKKKKKEKKTWFRKPQGLTRNSLSRLTTNKQCNIFQPRIKRYPEKERYSSSRCFKVYPGVFPLALLSAHLMGGKNTIHIHSNSSQSTFRTNNRPFRIRNRECGPSSRCCKPMNSQKSVQF